MEQIIIFHADGTSASIQNRRTATDVTSASQKITLNGANTVNIQVTSTEPQTFSVGDYVIVFGTKYKLNRLTGVRKTGQFNFQYDLEFESPQYDLLHASYNVNIDTTNNQIQDITGDSLTGDAARFLQVLVANANRVFPEKWIAGTCPDTDDDVTMTFGESDNCLSVLQNLCTKFETEYSIVTNFDGTYTINLGAVGQTLPYIFKYGRGNGLYSLRRDNVSSSNIITRLLTYGSTENITSKYRATRLCLPGKTKSQSYLEDVNAIAMYGIFEATKYFDIKPSFTGTVSNIVDTNILQFIDTSFPFDLSAKNEAGETLYLVAGTTAKIHFNSGNLAGYEFEVQSYDHTTHMFSLKPITDERGMVFPNQNSTAFKISVGNSYKIIDINYPDSITNAAEMLLQEKATEYFNQNKQPRVKYTCEITKRYLEDLLNGSAIENVFMPGDYLHIVDDNIGVDKSIRITDIERNILDVYDYKLNISDQPVTVQVITAIIADKANTDKIIEVNHLANPARAKNNWRTAQELLGMIFDTDGDYYSEKIKPLSIETTMLSVGAKSQQFTLNNIIFEANYTGNFQMLNITAGTLDNYSIDDDYIKTWNLAQASIYLDTTSAYYIYAKCEKNGTAGNCIAIQDQIKFNSDTNYYHFLIGTVSSPITQPDNSKQRFVCLTYGSSTVNGRFIKTGRIVSAGGDTYFDLDTGIISGKIQFIGSDQLVHNVADTNDAAIEAKNYINNTLPGILSGMQDQLDGQIEQFFDTYDPTTSNPPATEWTTTALKDAHLGDLFYNTTSGKVFRWVKTGATYYWTQLSDAEVSQALSLANDALALARTKRRIFTITPTTPYEVGDLWVQGTSGDIMRCVVERLSGDFSATDFEKASNYTSDAALNSFIAGSYTTDKQSLQNQIDGKIESWFQTTDPSAAWTTDALSILHVGDTWFNTNANTLNCYQKTTIASLTQYVVSTSFKFFKGTSIPGTPSSNIGNIWLDTANKRVKIAKTINNIIDWYAITNDNDNYIAVALFNKYDNNINVRISDTLPSYAYTVGDMWITQTIGHIYKCNKAYISGALLADWTDLGIFVYCWQRSYDQNAIDAIAAASVAQDTADGKRRVFVAQPQTADAYEIGDLWVNATINNYNNALLRCVTAKASGVAFNINHWASATSYDNTKTVIDGGLVTSGTIQVAGSENAILAGMTGRDSEVTSVRFFAGATFENRYSAPYRVLQNGKVIMTNADVSGNVNAKTGSIGGFVIKDGHIGVGDGLEQESIEGLSLNNSFVRFQNADNTQRVMIGCMNSYGYQNNGLFEIYGDTYSDGTTVELHHEHATGDDSMECFYHPRALDIYGNQRNLGKLALFETGYIGQAFTDIIQLWFNDTHKFVFTSNSVSNLSVKLPSKTEIQDVVKHTVKGYSKTPNVIVDIECTLAQNVTNFIRLRVQSGSYFKGINIDAQLGITDYCELRAGETIHFRYDMVNDCWHVISRYGNVQLYHYQENVDGTMVDKYILNKWHD